MKRMTIGIAVLGLFTGLGLGRVGAEVEEKYFSYGTVTQVGSGEIMIREYDYENDEETDYTFTLDENVELFGLT